MPDVSLDCASCERYACQAGRIDAAPETCPMLGDFPDFDTLYREEATREFALQAARVEGTGYCRWTRAREVVELANRLGYRRIGVGHCRDTRRAAWLTVRYLGSRGLDAVLPPVVEDCGPREQAGYFADRTTDLNVIAGMCVGHDTLFIRHSAAPVTSLVVRDRRLEHNPVAALYTCRGYLKAALYGRNGKRPAKSFAGWTDDHLDRLACAVRDDGARREIPPCRLEEVMDFADRAGVRHLGVVFCSGFQEEARHLKAVLGTNGFAVSSVCCKTGAVPKEELGIADADKVHPGQVEVLCNSLAQAELLDNDEVELVLLMGQCVGHDAATLTRLKTPAVCLVAKDRVLAHNTVAGLQQAAG